MVVNRMAMDGTSSHTHMLIKGMMLGMGNGNLF